MNEIFSYTFNIIAVVICATLLIYSRDGLLLEKNDEISVSSEVLSSSSSSLIQSEMNTNITLSGKGMDMDMVLESGSKCLEFDSSLDDLITSSGSVYLTAPSKVAGTTIQQFAWQCVGHYDTIYEKRDTKVFSSTSVEYRRDVFLENAEIPKILATHISSDRYVIRLFEQTPRDSLTMMVYRDETDRVISALRHILKETCMGIRDRFPPEELDMTDDGKCILGETSIADLVLQPRIEELRGGVQDILTCDLYESIENTFPNMVFVHVNQVDRLLGALAKHHCPDLADKSFHSHDGTRMNFTMFVKLEKTGELMLLEDWMTAKRDKIEWTFDYRGNKCRAKTRQMEDELFSCKDELLQVTRKTSF